MYVHILFTIEINFGTGDLNRSMQLLNHKVTPRHNAALQHSYLPSSKINREETVCHLAKISRISHEKETLQFSFGNLNLRFNLVWEIVGE